MFRKAFFCFFINFLVLHALFSICQARQKACLLLEHEQRSPWIDLLNVGLEKGGKDFDFETKVIIAPAGPNQVEDFRKAASEFDLVLVATDNLHEILRDNAANFRRIKFGCLDAGIRAPNIMSVTFADEQASFLAGLAAAMFVENKDPGIVAWLSGGDSPAARSLANGYAEGIKLVNPDLKFAQAITGSFVDGSLAAQKVGWLLDNGASIVALAAGAGNPEAQAILEKNNVWHIALDGYLTKKRALGLISKRTDKAVYEIMRSAASPKYAGKEILIFDLENEGVDFELSPEVIGDSSKKDIVRRVREVKSEIIKGSIKIPSLRARTLCDCLD